MSADKNRPILLARSIEANIVSRVYARSVGFVKLGLSRKTGGSITESHSLVRLCGRFNEYIINAHMSTIVVSPKDRDFDNLSAEDNEAM